MPEQIAIKSPIGPLLLEAEDGFITRLDFADVEPNAGKKFPEHTDNALLCKAVTQLQEYFAGKRKEFELPLKPKGTEFQNRVWQALCAIPYGETRSYKQVAESVGCPKGFRAVGLANNRNPIALIIPCHRVIGSGGSLVGYAGGTGKKQTLLNLERAMPLFDQA